MKNCNRIFISDDLFHTDGIIEAYLQWCTLNGLDSKDEERMSAFIMGARLAISNDGWCDCNS